MREFDSSDDSNFDLGNYGGQPEPWGSPEMVRWVQLNWILWREWQAFDERIEDHIRRAEASAHRKRHPDYARRPWMARHRERFRKRLMERYGATDTDPTWQEWWMRNRSEWKQWKERGGAAAE